MKYLAVTTLLAATLAVSGCSDESDEKTTAKPTTENQTASSQTGNTSDSSAAPGSAEPQSREETRNLWKEQWEKTGKSMAAAKEASKEPQIIILKSTPKSE